MIVPVDADRDEHGYWTHPALTRSGCEIPAKFNCKKGATDELV
ncbi:hypothetical protein ACMT9R_004350 [Salmonella enterica]